MQPVGKVNHSSDETNNIEPSFSIKEIVRSIAEIDALTIEMISIKIIGNIINNLGPTAKARIAQAVNQKRESSEEALTLTIHLMS